MHLNFTRNSYWPFFGAIFVLALMVCSLFFQVFQKNQQHLVYTLDDPYIHLSIARNIARNGVWGVTCHEFSSSSSSVFWIILLSGLFSLFGVHEGFPLLMNLGFAIGTLWFIFSIVKKREFHPVLSFLLLSFFMVLIPLPTLIFSGQEHIAHLFFSLLFLSSTARLLAQNEAPAISTIAGLALLAAVLCLVRYEGLFLVYAAFFLLLAQKKIAPAFALGFAGVIPLVIFGWYSITHGGFLLPNPVYLKGNQYAGSSITGFLLFFATGIGKNLLAAPELGTLLLSGLGSAFLLSASRSGEQQIEVFYGNVLFIITTVLHLAFAKIGWFFRYGAYLIGLGSLVSLLSARECQRIDAGARWRKSWLLPAIPLLVLFGYFSVVRIMSPLQKTVPAMVNIFQQ